MELHLSQTNHPDWSVAANALTHEDPYFQACWAPLLDPWTTHVANVTANLTRSHPVRLSLDQLSQKLNPEPAEFRLRAMTVTRSLHDLARKGFGQVEWLSHVRAEVRLYRQVPLVPEPELVRLTDPELCAHAAAITDVNRRRTAAGLPLLAHSPRVSARLHRADPAFRPPRPSPADAAIARLDQIAQSSSVVPPAL